MTSSVTDHPYV